MAKNSNGSGNHGRRRHEYRVYVIELSDKAGPRDDPRLPNLYVGQSSKQPKERFKQHKCGHKSSRAVNKFGLRLRPELYEDLLPATTQDEALEMEMRRADQLRNAGHTVRSNGKLDQLPKARRRGFDRSQIEPVIHLLDRAIVAVVGRFPGVIGVGMCTNILRGGSGERMSRLDVTNVPEYARFAHVQQDVVRNRIRELVDGVLGRTAEGRLFLRELIYGATPSDEIVFIPKEQAIELAGLSTALFRSKTWGQLRSAITPERYEQICERSVDWFEDEGEPADNAKFNRDQIYGYEDGEWPEWSAQEMLVWVPETIKRSFGHVEHSIVSGPALELDASRETEIVEAFKELGYSCERDDSLFLRAARYEY